MAITVGGVTIADATGSVTVTKPAGLADGDILLASAVGGIPSGTITPPAGWSTRDNIKWRDGSRPAYLFYKVVTSAAGEPSSYTFTASWSGTYYLTATVVAYRGVDPTTPFACASDGVGPTSVTGASITVSGITTAANDAMLVLYGFTSATTAPFSSSPVLTSVVATSPASGYGTSVWADIKSSAGITGSYTVSISPNTGGLGGILTALKPISAASHPLAGDATATSSASATRLSLAQPLSGSAAGTSSAAATTLRLSHPLAGSSVATSAATAAGLLVGHALAGSAAATSSAAALRITEAHPLSGASAGQSSATATVLAIAHPLAGSATATSSASAVSISPDTSLAGSATATSSASAARLTLTHPLTGSAASQSSATATTLHLAHPLAGSAAAESLGIAAGLILSHPLAGEAIALTSASADLTSLLPYNPPGKATRTMRAGIVATRTQRPTITATRVQRGG